MQELSQPTKVPELYCHPHSLDVRRVLLDMHKIIAGKGPRGETFLRDHLTMARNAPLQVSSVEYGTKQDKNNSRLVVPVRTKLTVIAHDPLPDSYDGRKMYSSSTAIDRLDDFYFRHIDEHYLQHGMRPLTMFREVMTDVFTAIQKLHPVCLFHVRSLQNSTLRGIADPEQREALLKNDIVGIRAVLRDEYLIDEKYNFKAEIQLISPSAALAIAAQRSKKGNAP